MNQIFGYTFDQIRRAQQGGRLSEVVDVSKPSAGDGNLAADQALLAKHGLDGLKAMGYLGVVDRLERAGLTTTNPGGVCSATDEDRQTSRHCACGA